VYKVTEPKQRIVYVHRCGREFPTEDVAWCPTCQTQIWKGDLVAEADIKWEKPSSEAHKSYDKAYDKAYEAAYGASLAVHEAAAFGAKAVGIVLLCALGLAAAVGVFLFVVQAFHWAWDFKF
jgi:hypothetical protein